MFDPTLNGLLAQVEAGKIVLPAMQRPFVWKEDRITRLIDSMLRGFPLGTALLWKTSTMQRFRRFQKDVQPNAGITVDFDSGKSSESYLVLDGQQRLTSLYVAMAGTYQNKKLYVDALSGDRGDKDPGDTYWDCRFLTETEAKTLNASTNHKVGTRTVFVRLQDLVGLRPATAAMVAVNKANELGLSPDQQGRITKSYLECAVVLASKTALQIHLIDEDAGMATPIEEILEIFVRVNSGGLVLQKSDLLMSLLDLNWNDIQPELYRAVKVINDSRPYKITRDDVLKSLLTANGSDTRFDRLVSDRDRVEELAVILPKLLPPVEVAWKSLTSLLLDGCKISSERFFRGGHNALLPFVQYFVLNPAPSPAERRRLVFAIYVVLMSGVFSGAEARMAAFVKKHIKSGKDFPVKQLAQLVEKHYGVRSLEDLLSRHLDLALNIAHGGITLDNNPEELQRDHIFPRSTLEKGGVAPARANHFANFHFLRGTDNLNKSDTPPHLWFAAPGERTPYTAADLNERLMKSEWLQPGMFDTLIDKRTQLIHERALSLFGYSAEVEINQLFVSDTQAEAGQQAI